MAMEQLAGEELKHLLKTMTLAQNILPKQTKKIAACHFTENLKMTWINQCGITECKGQQNTFILFAY